MSAEELAVQTRPRDEARPANPSEELDIEGVSTEGEVKKLASEVVDLAADDKSSSSGEMSCFSSKGDEAEGGEEANGGDEAEGD